MRDSLALEIDTMLWPDCSVQNFALEIRQTLEWRNESLCRESDAWDKPLAVDFTAVRALNEPLMSFLIEHGSVYMFVVGDILLQVPFLFDILEVSPEFPPARVSFCEGETFP